MLRLKDVIEEQIMVEQQLTVDVADVNSEGCQSTETHPTERQPPRFAILVEKPSICSPPYGIRGTNQELSYTV